MELTASEQLLYSTVKITASMAGTPKEIGTGFFFRFCTHGGNHIPALVTNKHVLKQYDQATINCHLAKDGMPSGEFIGLDIETKGRVIKHPSEAIDLCALLIGDGVAEFSKIGMPLFYVSLDHSLIPKDGDWQYFDAIEDVMMIGCPRGISDEVNNLPIIRRGITASPMSKDYNGKPEFMVDMACFPGSSGSPVFIYDRMGYMDRKANTYRIDGRRLHLVGILYEGPIFTNKGQVVLAEPPAVTVPSMMHLGNIIKASELEVLDREVRKFVDTLPH